MVDQNVKLLQEVNAGCKYATNSLNQIMGFVDDRSLKTLIEKYHREHEELGNKAHQMLDRCDNCEKEPNPMAKAMSWVGTETKLMANHENSKIVELLMDGCNMGIQNLSSAKNECEAASKEAKELADKVVSVEQKFVDDLKGYA